MNVLKRTGLAIAALTLLVACEGERQQQVYFAQRGGQWVEISKAEYETGATSMTSQGFKSASDAEIRAAIARNPNSARSYRQVPLNATPEQIADLSLQVALDLCNIPEGTRIDDATLCQF